MTSSPNASIPPETGATNGCERRLHARIAFHTRAHLRTGALQREVEVLDISLKGALLRLPNGDETPTTARLESGADCQLEVLLDDTRGTIRMDVRVAHVGDGLLGVVCQLIDIDSATHLRRLVELNLGDPALLERELSALIAD